MLFKLEVLCLKCIIGGKKCSSLSKMSKTYAKKSYWSALFQEGALQIVDQEMPQVFQKRVSKMYYQGKNVVQAWGCVYKKNYWATIGTFCCHIVGSQNWAIISNVHCPMAQNLAIVPGIKQNAILLKIK